jgi:uncharacterized metal-binding protein YceD (DUF177 family)
LKIELRKVPFNKSEFETSFNNIVMKGSFYKESPNIAKIDAVLSGKVEVECVKCLQPFLKKVDEKLKLIITDRIYSGFDKEYDVIEINSNIIDFNDIITSEIESVKLEYNNICEKCKESDLDLEI